MRTPALRLDEGQREICSNVHRLSAFSPVQGGRERASWSLSPGINTNNSRNRCDPAQTSRVAQLALAYWPAVGRSSRAGIREWLSQGSAVGLAGYKNAAGCQSHASHARTRPTPAFFLTRTKLVGTRRRFCNVPAHGLLFRIGLLVINGRPSFDNFNSPERGPSACSTSKIRSLRETSVHERNGVSAPRLHPGRCIACRARPSNRPGPTSRALSSKPPLINTDYGRGGAVWWQTESAH